MNNLSGTPYENSFLDEALKRDLRGDDLYEEADRFYQIWRNKLPVKDGEARLYDQTVWGVTEEEFGISSGPDYLDFPPPTGHIFRRQYL